MKVIRTRKISWIETIYGEWHKEDGWEFEPCADEALMDVTDSKLETHFSRCEQLVIAKKRVCEKS
jgi:hypothetical protein